MIDEEMQGDSDGNGESTVALWEGRQWRVVPGFLEASTVSSVYDISWRSLGPRQHPIHWDMAGKQWVDFDDFCDAYRKAVELAGIEPHDIDAMEAAGRVRKAAV